MEFEYGSISMEVLKFCMDSSMILYKKKLLGYGLLGFSLDINLVPFLGFC